MAALVTHELVHELGVSSLGDLFTTGSVVKLRKRTQATSPN